MANHTLHFIFENSPSHDPARFVELETAAGKSINLGEWRKRDDGYFELVIDLEAAIANLEERERGERPSRP